LLDEVATAMLGTTMLVLLDVYCPGHMKSAASNIYDGKHRQGRIVLAMCEIGGSWVTAAEVHHRAHH
jgi:hypothetical protein